MQLWINGRSLRPPANAEPSGSVLELLRQTGVAFAAPCGGLGTCGKCRARLFGEVSAPNERERALLSEAELASGIRLACQARVTGTNVRVELPDSVDMAGVLEGAAADFPLHPLGKALGLAVDIGTTTLAAYLYDLTNGAPLGAALMENPQRAFGADVTARLSFSLAGGAAQLQKSVCACIDALAERLCKARGREPREIDAAVLTGNTAMLYFLTGRDSRDIAAYPFAAEELFGKEYAASALPLHFAPDCRVYLPRCISAYVGADVVCAILATGLCEQTGTAMLADIGTNGEMVLRRDGRLLCCSTAAGPAFEGAGLSCGSCALPGAVDAVWLAEGKLSFHTIADRTPASLCGSGALDLLACLLENGTVDDGGCLAGNETRGGASAYALTRDVYLTQKDVRALQLAKAAFRAGMETLTGRAGAAETLLLAGGFGNRLNVESALRIGMFPAWSRGRIRPVGNAAGMGAVRLLLDATAAAPCEKIAASAETLPLAADPAFSEAFIEHMSFDEGKS